MEDYVRKLHKHYKHFKHYTIIADEVTDRYSNKTILLLCIRYLNCTKERPAIEVVFLRLLIYQEDRWVRIQVNTPSHGIIIEDCRGQAYCGAPAACSTVKGASSVIKKKQPLAEFVHCKSNCLNLVIVFACKNDVVIKFMDDLTSLCYFFPNSSKRQQYFETFIDYHKDELSISDSNKKQDIGLTKMRWVERHKAQEN